MKKAYIKITLERSSNGFLLTKIKAKKKKYKKLFKTTFSKKDTFVIHTDKNLIKIKGTGPKLLKKLLKYRQYGYSLTSVKNHIELLIIDLIKNGLTSTMAEGKLILDISTYLDENPRGSYAQFFNSPLPSIDLDEKDLASFIRVARKNGVSFQIPAPDQINLEHKVVSSPLCTEIFPEDPDVYILSNHEFFLGRAGYDLKDEIVKIDHTRIKENGDAYFSEIKKKNPNLTDQQIKLLSRIKVFKEDRFVFLKSLEKETPSDDISKTKDVLKKTHFHSRRDVEDSPT